MGNTLRAVPFFVDEIAIVPHSASNPKYLGCKVSIREFSRGKPVSLYDIEGTNEYLIKLSDGTFIEGPEYRGEE